MKYKQLSLQIKPYSPESVEILTAFLADAGCDSFIQEEEILKAFVPATQYDEEKISQTIQNFPIPHTEISFETTDAEDKDWNKEWEQHYFQPIVLGDNLCCVHSTFHKDVPGSLYDIVINPQMAFGTGHHATTSLILSELLETDLKGKALLDMGCGTSILAILAAMRGANPVTAIDIDDWCVENSKENIHLNNLDGQINVMLGDASLLADLPKQDIILANINRNILLQDMPAYAQTLNPRGGEIWMSGFYTQDIPVLMEKAEQIGFTYVSDKEKDNWACLHLKFN
ncbi:MAG: 50S ribosomal protein L11 methyltransferase [Bacteroidaceae bacterium]|jgi:ribosomal protein L11 methyltransferase